MFTHFYIQVLFENALFEFMYSTGCGIGEAITLEETRKKQPLLMGARACLGIRGNTISISSLISLYGSVFGELL
ncbi:hypothetical protein M0L17_11945 [Bacillaceae bacterium OS4b]|nr:hypothetical protein [Bacillaceae bacterium OS4b]